MNTYNVVAKTLPTLAALSLLAACASDPNPIDRFQNQKTENPTISLKLKVASANAEETGLTTAEEQSIADVNVFIFNQFGFLEKIIPHVDLQNELEVQPGVKTLFAVSAANIMASATPFETKVEDFNNAVFNSTLDQLHPQSGFVMTGWSEPQTVVKSVGGSDLPASNVFDIEMHRMLAKVQVSYADLDDSSFDFKVGTPSFKVFQTSDKMRLAPNGEDVHASWTDTDGDGTYDGYSLCPDPSYINANANGFSADNCHYMPENIVNGPSTGNSTFVSVCIPLAPRKYHTYSEDTGIADDPATPSLSPATFYAVGITDANNGFADYVTDSQKHIIVFKSSDMARDYCDALNGGETSPIMVSDTDLALRPAYPHKAGATANSFEVMEFTGGKTYYRVNVMTKTDGQSVAKVLRNKFYKISVNSVSSLGFHSESLLRPKDPASSLQTVSGLWIDATFNVAEWDEEEQSVDL